MQIVTEHGTCPSPFQNSNKDGFFLKKINKNRAAEKNHLISWTEKHVYNMVHYSSVGLFFNVVSLLLLL